MQYSQRIFLADDTLPRDEIDDLFERLEPIKPPPSLIQRILTSVARLPRPLPPALPINPWVPGEKKDVPDGPIVRNEKLPPN